MNGSSVSIPPPTALDPREFLSAVTSTIVGRSEAATRRVRGIARTRRDTSPSSGGYFESSANVTTLRNVVPEFELRIFVERRLAALTSDRHANPSSAALASLRRVVRDFVASGGPTPQLGSTPSGSVELQWLSNGTLVSALFYNDGEYNLYAETRDEEVLFDFDVSAGEAPTPAEARVIETVLAEMGTSVTTRPSLWI